MVSSFRISRLEEEEEEGERHRKIRENKKRLSILRVSYESLTRELEELYKPRVVDLISRSHRWRLNSTENTVIMKRYHPVNVPVSNRVPPPSCYWCTCFRANSNFLAARKPFRGARPGKQGVNEQSGPFDNISPFTVSRSFFYPLPLRPERIHRKELSSAV